MIIAGIDYSMTCPCITVCESDNFTFAKCKIYYLTEVKRHSGKFGKNITGTFFDRPKSQIDRYIKISEWAYEIVKDCDQILMEGYSMGSKGAVFNIAENTAMLKYQLHIHKKMWNVIPPTVLKKYATGKGNSDKNAMHKEFSSLTGVDLEKIYPSSSKKLGSPVSDIVDSFYIAKHLSENVLENSYV